MVARPARSTIAALCAALAMFLLLVLMVVRVPAIADPGNGKANGHADTASTDAAGGSADKGKSGDANGNAAAAHDAKGKPETASTNSPQPPSNADQNPGGANNGGDCGAYCSTRDGSASGNGNGGGAANGKPCAGCVGKADNKNPPGQAPDGSDHNNGYECDGNNGIAKTNPAHTGCTTQSPTPTPTGCVPSEENDDCGTPSPGCTPSAENDNCGTPTPGCTPFAENDNCGTPSETPSVLPSETESPSPTITPSVKGVKIVKPPTGSLPRTGSPVSVGVLLLVGFGAVAIGVGCTVTSPKRH